LYALLHTTPTTHLHTLSLHDALPISLAPTHCGNCSQKTERIHVHKHGGLRNLLPVAKRQRAAEKLRQHGALLRLQQKLEALRAEDRKSTRLNSSHVAISYAVFCLKKK